MENIAELVKCKGLIAVTTQRFLPPCITARHRHAVEIVRDGKGKWIVVKNFRSRKLKKVLAPYMGNPGEITLDFSDHTSVLQISKDGDGIIPVCQ